MSESSSKSNKVYKIIIAILIIIIGAGGYFGGNYIYDKGYADGHNDGYTLGYETGFETSETDRYYDTKFAYIESKTSTINNDGYLTTDAAPDGTVWTTPSGEKYHEGWCRYVADRTDLTYFTSALEAQKNGYSPCSVCH